MIPANLDHLSSSPRPTFQAKERINPEPNKFFSDLYMLSPHTLKKKKKPTKLVIYWMLPLFARRKRHVTRGLSAPGWTVDLGYFIDSLTPVPSAGVAPVIIYYVWNMLTYVCASAEDRGGHHSQPYSLEIGPFSKPAARLGWRPESPASLWFLTPQRWRPLVGVSHAQVFLIVFPGFLFVCFTVGAGDSNSSPHGCTTSALTSYPLSHHPGPKPASKCSTLALPMGSGSLSSQDSCYSRPKEGT